MKQYELTCKAYIKKDINFKNSFETLAKYINYTIVQSEYEDLHYKNRIKHYVFSGFRTNKSNDSIYKAGDTKEFQIRSLDEKFITDLAINLRKNINNPNFLIIQTTKRVIEQFFITELYSATPIIVSTSNSRFWTNQEPEGLSFLYNQLQNNLIKKYESFFDEKLNFDGNFIQLLEQKNEKPQNIQIEKNGKIIRFFGNKFKIIPNEDEISQKLAFTALSCGLGEKNSYGGGFCLGRGIKIK